MKIILASNSPRRKELLKEHNIEFIVIPSNVDEVIDINTTPYENVMRLAEIKGKDVFEKNIDALVIAADTIVVFNNEILGKPKDEADAFRMLRLLSGNTHEVVSGVSILYKDKIITEYEISKVKFKKLTDEDILSYIETKEPMDKAGSYAIQGIGGKFIEYHQGEFDNIVGLPMKLVIRNIKKAIED